MHTSKPLTRAIRQSRATLPSYYELVQWMSEQRDRLMALETQVWALRRTVEGKGSLAAGVERHIRPKEQGRML